MPQSHLEFDQIIILKDIKSDCKNSITISPKDAKRFFKTGEGSYSAHDEFLGITSPNLRKIAKKYKDTELQIIKKILQSKYNEERLLALMMLVQQYQRGNLEHQEKLASFYLQNLSHINNWNLVDSSAHHILGHYLWDKDRAILIKLASSDVLWERRIAIVATWYFIRMLDLEWTFKIAKLLLNDSHDLIHKAVGWMLREAGKKDDAKLLSFLSDYLYQMPRTMLRYATERLSNEQRSILKKFR